MIKKSHFTNCNLATLQYGILIEYNERWDSAKLRDAVIFVTGLQEILQMDNMRFLTCLCLVQDKNYKFLSRTVYTISDNIYTASTLLLHNLLICWKTFVPVVSYSILQYKLNYIIFYVVCGWWVMTWLEDESDNWKNLVPTVVDIFYVFK